MKPEDIPQWVWIEASEHLTNYASGPITAHECVARSILQARSQAFEESVKIAEDHIWATSAISRASDYEAGGSDVAQVISQAIRQHSQKGES